MLSFCGKSAQIKRLRIMLYTQSYFREKKISLSILFSKKFRQLSVKYLKSLIKKWNIFSTQIYSYHTSKRCYRCLTLIAKISLCVNSHGMCLSNIQKSRSLIEMKIKTCYQSLINITDLKVLLWKIFRWGCFSRIPPQLFFDGNSSTTENRMKPNLWNQSAATQSFRLSFFDDTKNIFILFQHNVFNHSIYQMLFSINSNLSENGNLKWRTHIFECN